MQTKKSPMVSVIIPTYNRGWSVKAAIDSVLAQDYHNIELIVVDDGSTDNTRNVLEVYQSSLIVIRQQNRGVSAARNSGIAASKGSFISFLDSDDLWLPEKLSRQIEFFKAHPKALICQTEEIWIRNDVRVNPKKRHKKPSGMIFEKSLALCLVSPSAVMIRKSLFDIIGLFDESLPACEDYDLWLRTSARFPVYLIDKPLIIKKGGHSDQLSKMSGLDRFRIRSLNKIIKSGILNNGQHLAAVKTLKQKCLIYAQGCQLRAREAEARYFFDLAHRYE
ncbi:glycosyltransferase family 2 protein [Thermodesulfobacteriota bacterium]